MNGNPEQNLTAAGPSEFAVPSADNHRQRFFADQMDASQHRETTVENISNTSKQTWWLKTFGVPFLTILLTATILCFAKPPFVCKKPVKSKKSYNQRKSLNLPVVFGLSITAGVTVLGLPYIIKLMRSR